MTTRRRFLEGAAVATVGGLAGAACRPRDLLAPPRLGPGPGPFEVPTAASVDLVGHVLSRCTYGPRPGDREALLGLAASPFEAVDAWIDRQLHAESIDDHAVEHRLRAFESTFLPAGDLYEMKRPVLLADLTRATLLRAVYSRRQLHEVMVEFWTDHFNIDMSKGDCAWLKAADDREVVRAHALGSFPALLRSSARSPAMLWYLDGRVNRRATADERPNENYARELLELHTLGVDGGYTQRDVMEVARALTGWTVRPRSGFGKGRVEFRPELHDDGTKVVLGQHIPPGLGPGDLDRVLDVVAVHPATARHLATKLCRRFVAENPPAAAVSAVAHAFLRSRGDIQATLQELFARPEFRSDSPATERLRASKLKRPFHFVVSALRVTDADTDVGTPVANALVAMGQAPFQYPTPDGYPEEAEAWQGSLLWRFKVAGELAANTLAGTTLDVKALARRAGGAEALAAHVLGRHPRERERAALEAGRGGGDDLTRGLALLLASPAFQRY